MFENISEKLLAFDRELLISAHQSFPIEYVKLLKFSSESIVIWCMLFLVGLWLYSVTQKTDHYKKISLKIFFLIITVFLVYGAIYFLIPQFRPHPGEYLGNIAIQPLIPHPLDNSFPSGHAIFSTTFFIAVCLYFRNFWILLITLIFGIITVCSRILGGVHYPGDIVGGILFANIAVLFLKNLSEYIYENLSPHLLQIAKMIKL